MPYQIIPVPTGDPRNAMWGVQNLLRSSAFSGWRYIYGVLGGVVVADVDWDAVVDPAAEILDGDYIILQLPCCTVGSDNGVVGIHYVAGVGTYLVGYPSGWDVVGGVSKDPATELCAAGGALISEPGGVVVVDIRVVANERRAIIVCRDALGNLGHWGYFGLIQSHYTNGIPEAIPDPNPLMVGAAPLPPSSWTFQPEMLNSAGNPDVYLCSAGIVATSMFLNLLDLAQHNYRDGTPLRTLIPCLTGCTTHLSQEIRGELEGVFYYGPPASLGDNTVVTRDGADYIILHDVVIGPIL